MSASLIGRGVSNSDYPSMRCDIARELMLLFGIGTWALPSWVGRVGGTISWAALPSVEPQRTLRSHRTHRPGSAVTTDSFHHQAQPPKSSAVHKLGRPVTPSFRGEADMPSWAGHVAF